MNASWNGRGRGAIETFKSWPVSTDKRPARGVATERTGWTSRMDAMSACYPFFKELLPDPPRILKV